MRFQFVSIRALDNLMKPPSNIILEIKRHHVISVYI